MLVKTSLDLEEAYRKMLLERVVEDISRGRERRSRRYQRLVRTLRIKQSKTSKATK